MLLLLMVDAIVLSLWYSLDTVSGVTLSGRVSGPVVYVDTVMLSFGYSLDLISNVTRSRWLNDSNGGM